MAVDVTAAGHPQDPSVAAVLVCHDGARWLPRVLAALRAQTRPVDQLVVVDTGSRDSTVELLRGLLPPEVTLLQQPRRTSFGDAVRAAVASLTMPDAVDTDVAGTDTADLDARRVSAPAEPWLWLLHDDSAPEPGALEALLAHSAAHPLADVLGCKARGWNDRRALLEVGFTTSRSGRRDTGLEPLEQDQGQHDTNHEVLAVGTAGMLVRLDVWRALGGLDRRLPLFRDDLDLCWQVWRSGGEVHVVPAAVVAHAEAATMGRRVVSVAGRRPHYLDRRHAALTLLRHRALPLVPLLMLRVVLGGLVRTVGFLLGKAPGFAIDEARALLALVLRPDQLVVGRWKRSRRIRALRRSRSAVSAQRIPPLTTPRAATRHAWEGLLAIGSGAASALAVGTKARRAAPVETGPVADEAQDLTSAPSTLLALLRRPVVLLLLALLVVTLVADRGLLGSGRLVASGMLPAPDGAGDWWHLARWPWHDVGGGTAQQGPLWTLLLAALSTLTFGNAPLAVDILVLGAVPLAALSAALSLRGLVRTTSLRVAAAFVWAAQPLVLVGVAHATLPVVVAAVVLPPAAAAVARVVGGGGRRGSGRAGAAGALAVAVLGSVVPAVAALVCAAAVITLVALLVVRGVRGVARRGAAAAGGASIGGLLALAVLPPLLLWPDVVRIGGGAGPVWPRLLAEAGTVVPAWPSPPSAWQVLLAVPARVSVLSDVAGLGTVALAVLAGLALLRRDRRPLATRAWFAALLVLVATVGLAMAAAATSARVRAAGTVWPTASGPGRGLVSVLGLALVAALIAAALAGAAGVRPVLTAHRFGWRQPLAAVLVAATLAVPAVALAVTAGRGAGVVGRGAAATATAVGHAGDRRQESQRNPQPQVDLQRVTPLELPAYVAAAAHTGAAPRSLVLAQPSAAAGLGVSLVGRAPARLGDESLPAAPAALLPVAADLASGRLVDVADSLSPWAVRFVVVAAPVPTHLRAALDATPGLQRVGGQRGSQVWEVSAAAPRAVVEPIAGSSTDARLLPVHEDARRLVDVRLAAEPIARVVRLAEPDEGNWQASLDGRALNRASARGGVAFAVPAGVGGELVIGYPDTAWWPLLVGLAALVLTVVMALPGVRRTAPDEAEPVTADLMPAASDEAGVDQAGADVPGADVPGADVPGADVPGADVPGADVASQQGAASDVGALR